ncbi:MAG TPA: hypothetical protein VGP92_03810 [Acidimicrobiia bacterium]|nr:hypothetical protein [Acidimicrobiia bacterium]
MPPRLDRTGRQRLGWGAVWIAVLTYGWWFTERVPFSDGAFRALVVAIGVLLAAAVARRFVPSTRAPGPVTSRRGAPGFRTAVALWSAIVVAVVAWELIALGSSPRSDHPTISSFVESVEMHHIGRLVLFAGWIGLGWMLAS